MGSGVRFDGSDDYIELPTLDIRGSTLTIAAWISSRSFPPSVDQRFVSKAIDTSEPGHYWMVGLIDVSGQKRLRFRLKAGGTTSTLVASSGELPIDTWYHVAATYDGVAMRLYLNGAEVGVLPKTGTIDQNPAVPVSIGRHPDASNHMSGAIDDVRIYDRALTAAEIASISF
jgi:hypothetical protein